MAEGGRAREPRLKEVRKLKRAQRRKTASLGCWNSSRELKALKVNPLSPHETGSYELETGQ
jgi:hypothetical protein